MATAALDLGWNCSYHLERDMLGAFRDVPGTHRPHSIVTAKGIAADIDELQRVIPRKRKYPDAPVFWRGSTAYRADWQRELAQIVDGRLSPASSKQINSAFSMPPATSLQPIGGIAR